MEVSIIRFDYDRLRWNTNRSRGNRFTSRSLEELLMFELIKKLMQKSTINIDSVINFITLLNFSS